MKKTFLAIAIVSISLASTLDMARGQGVNNLYWSGTGTTQGGSGTWDTTHARWGLFPGGPYDFNWDNTANDEDAAKFEATAGTVQLAGPINLAAIVTSIGGYSIGNGSGVSGSANTLSFFGNIGEIYTNQTSGTTTLTSFLSGTTIFKYGVGRLEIDNSANAATNKFVLNAGALTAPTPNRFGAPAGLVPDFFTFDGGGLGVNSTTAYDMGTNRGVTINSGGAFFGATNSSIVLTIGAPVVGLGGITIDGSASPFTGSGHTASPILVLSNTSNSWSGDTTIASGGTLRLGASDVVPDGSAKGNITANGTFDLNTFSETINGLSGSGTVDTAAGGTPTLTVGNNNATSTFGGVIKNTTGTLALTKIASGIGTGTLTLTGANTYTGATTISGGSQSKLITNFLADGGVASGIGQSSNAASNLVFDGGTLKYTGPAVSTDRNFSLGVKGGSIEAAGTGALTFSSTGTIDLPGTGTRTLTLTGHNADDNTLSQVIADQGSNATSLLKADSLGTWVVSGNNTFTGGTTVIGGTLKIGHNNALGTGTLALSDVSSAIAASGGARTIPNNVVISSNTTISGTQDLTTGGSVTNSGGSRTLTSTNTGATTLAGPVYLSEASGTGRTLTIGGTGSVVISGDIANFNGSGTAGSLTIADPGSGNSHTLTLSGNNTYSGNTILNIRSHLNINSATALGTSTFVVGATTGLAFDNTSGAAITLANANNINLSGGSPTFTGTNDLSFGNNTVAISGANRTITTTAGTLTIGSITQDVAGRNFTKSGAGTLVVLGTGSYSGTTTVSGGALLANGSLTGAGAVTIASGATLGGNGTVSGAVTNNGTIAPGASIGTLNLNSSLALANNSILNFELGTVGTHDLINIGTNLTLPVTGSVTVNLANTGGMGAGTFTLIDYADTLSGNFSTLMLGMQPSGFTYSLINNTANTSIDLQVISLPGDYNNNHTVDAADYVVWRKNQGTTNTLLNDPTGGTIGTTQYNTWRTHFGQSGDSGSGASANATVAEPATLVLLLVGIVATFPRQRAAVS